MSKYLVRPHRGRRPWLVSPMANRGSVIAGVMIHSTRSGQPGAFDDLSATENWGNSPSNGSAAQGYGSYWDEIIGRNTGERVICTDWDREYATWCAGYGGSGTWAAGVYYIQIEVCQARIDQPFSAASIDSLAESVAEKSIKYNFPLSRISYLEQTGTPPRGICTHEDSANGRRLGKSDPGPLFPWGDFLQRARAYVQAMQKPEEPMGMTDEERDELDALKLRVDSINRDLLRAERLLVGNGIYNKDGQILTRQAAIEDADARGLSIGMGVQHAQTELVAVKASIETLVSAMEDINPIPLDPEKRRRLGELLSEIGKDLVG